MNETIDNYILSLVPQCTWENEEKKVPVSIYKCYKLCYQEAGWYTIQWKSKQRLILVARNWNETENGNQKTTEQESK